MFSTLPEECLYKINLYVVARNVRALYSGN